MTVALVGLRAEPLSVDEVLAAVAHPAAGASCVFVGTVRDHDHGHEVTALDYSAHPTAVDVMAEVAARVASEASVLHVAVVHRTGRLLIGDMAIVAAASAAHRDEAFAVARRLVDDVKAGVPIWKHQVFADGSNEWVGLP